MAEISNLLSHFNAMCHNICVKPDEGYNLLGAFESALPKQSLCIFKEVIFKRNLTIITFNSKKERCITVVFQCEENPKKGTTQHASRHNVNVN